MKKGVIALCASLLLGACASAPLAPLPARDQIRDFALEARFALRVTQTGQKAENAGGRLSWEHKNGNNHLLIANPLGFTLAEIDTTPELSRLQTADGKIRTSPDAEALIEEVTGQRLPIIQLPGWLLGQNPGPDTRLDPNGRPSRRHEAGWTIDYTYADDHPDTLPERLMLNRDGEIELRLRIEEWKVHP